MRETDVPGLDPAWEGFTTAFVYGSVEKRQDTAASDIDLMVLSDTVSYPELLSALEAPWPRSCAIRD